MPYQTIAHLVIAYALESCPCIVPLRRAIVLCQRALLSYPCHIIPLAVVSSRHALKLWHCAVQSSCASALCRHIMPCTIAQCVIASWSEIVPLHRANVPCHRAVSSHHVISNHSPSGHLVMLSHPCHCIELSSYRAVPSHRAVILCYIIPLPSVFGTHAVAIAFASWLCGEPLNHIVTPRRGHHIGCCSWIHARSSFRGSPVVSCCHPCCRNDCSPFFFRVHLLFKFLSRIGHNLKAFSFAATRSSSRQHCYSTVGIVEGVAWIGGWCAIIVWVPSSSAPPISCIVAPPYVI